MALCPSSDTLSQLLDGLLTPEDGHAVGEHLRRCAGCQARIDRLSEDSALREWADAGAARPVTGAEPGLTRAVAALKAAVPPSATDTPADGATPPPAAPRDWLGALGPYVLDEELGRGGMGIVFRAHDAALRRTVAIKVLRPELADAHARARFLREARAAARFRHEHAVAVHAVNDTSDGLPYLVMEYVAGPTLAGLLRARQRLDPREAAVVAAQVADALAAAHAAGLVHRDVKPSNILLEAASPPRARLADFGLAREGAAATVLTREGVLAGTPAYMSPEQIRGAEPLDGRADVYSLGVTLYEALTGELPFRGVPHMVLQQALHDEPRPPRALNDSVPRDLETVCLKAMAKDPGRRYRGAADLAADLRRWLRGEPVQARPAGRAERLGRWARRNPRVAVLAAALVLALAGGVGGIVWAWSHAVAERVVAGRERDDARGQRARALAELRRARQTVDRYLTDVSEDPELKTRNLEPLRRKLLQRARDDYERFVAEYPDDPELLAELGRAHGRLGEIVGVLDSQPRALEHFERARAIFEQLRQEHPDDADYQGELARTMQRLGTAHAAGGNFALAAEDFRSARALWEGLVREHPDDAEPVHRLMQTLNNLGRIRQMGQFRDEAEEAYQAGRAAYARWAEQHPAEPRHDDSLAWVLTNLGTLYGQTGRPDLQGEVLRKAVALADRLVRENPAVDFYKETLFHAANEQGLWHARRGEVDPAEAAWKQAEAVAEELVRKHPAADEHNDRLSAIQHNLGMFQYFQRHRPAEALAYYEKALAVRERLCRDYPTVVAYAVGLHATAVNLGWLLTEMYQLPAALDVHDRAIRCLESAGPVERLAPGVWELLGQEHHERAVVLVRMKRYAEAVAALERAADLCGEARQREMRLKRTGVEGYDRAARGDHEGAAALAQSVADEAPTDGPLLYLAATVLAVDAAAVSAQERLPLPTRERLADQYAGRAVQLLHRAHAAGRFRTPGEAGVAETDETLAFLRSRDDFRQLVKAVRANPAGSKP